MEFLGGCDCGEPDERGVAALKLEEPEEHAVVEEQQQGVKTAAAEVKTAGRLLMCMMLGCVARHVVKGTSREVIKRLCEEVTQRE